MPSDKTRASAPAPQSAAPTPQELKQMLGPAHHSYLELVKLTASLSHEWKDYGQKHGWQCKVVQRKKALFYLFPQPGSLRIAFAVRESERDALLESPLPATVKESLRAAKRYPEGYPLRLTVTGESTFTPVRRVIAALLSLRS